VLLGERAAVTRLTGEFDELQPMRGGFACPVDDGSEIVALLAYPHGRSVTISVNLRGCNSVTNGDVFRTALGTKLVAQLERLIS
jgi:hypothetical protein